MPTTPLDNIRLIVPSGWEQLQHRDATRGKSGNPMPWIRLHTRWHHSDAYLKLSSHLRAVLVGVWIEYAASGGNLRLDTASLTRRLNIRVTSQNLDALEQAGFLRFVPAARQRDASPKEREEREERREWSERSERTSAALSADHDEGEQWWQEQSDSDIPF